MRTARETIELDGSIAAAEELWYDVARWSTFVDGFGHVAKLEGDWPQKGATLVWDSPPNGRGRVVERVVEYEARVGQTTEVEDERLRGRQSVAFDALADGVNVSVSLEYALKRTNPLQPLVDLLFIRRALGDSLRRTLLRFERELTSDLELLR